MGNVLSYSGLSTKIRAMQSRLITEKELEEIVQLTSVPQVIAYLKKTPEYESAWAEVDENHLHRGEAEKLLKKSIFNNFSRLYHFANKEQRNFLTLYSKRYEILVLKSILTNLFDRRDTDPVDLSPYRSFFRQHSKLDTDRLTAARNIEEFVNALRGNEFYEPLSKVLARGNGLLFDYGNALDLYYYGQVWHMRDKIFSKQDLAVITRTYGAKFDMLNLEFIQRSRQYYHMNPASVYSTLIPMNYKLKRTEISALAEASTYEESKAILDQTYYAHRYPGMTPANLEEFYTKILRTTLETEAGRDPYSVAIIYSYLYHKEHEVNRLTIALECVRYGVDREEAMRYIRSN